jgi:hypothetical protein
MTIVAINSFCMMIWIPRSSKNAPFGRFFIYTYPKAYPKNSSRFCSGWPLFIVLVNKPARLGHIKNLTIQTPPRGYPQIRNGTPLWSLHTNLLERSAFLFHPQAR